MPCVQHRINYSLIFRPTLMRNVPGSNSLLADVSAEEICLNQFLSGFNNNNSIVIIIISN